MDPVSVVVGAISLVATTSALVLDTLDIYFRTLAHAINLYRLYGPSGLILLFFGSRTTWRVEAQVLGQLDDDVAMDFKKSVQDECTMISTAVSSNNVCENVKSALTQSRPQSRHRLLSPRCR